MIKRVWIGLGIGTLMLSTSCTTYRILDTTRALDQVESGQNRWGKITVSGFSLVANKGQFKVAANEDVTNYINAARQNISGAASSSVATALFMAAQANGSFVPPISAGSPPSSNSSNGPLPTLPNQAQTAVNGFPAGANLSGLTPATDERDAVVKGINDKTAENLLEYLLNPAVDTNSEAVVFGVMQVTCQPGEKTRKGYVGELDVELSYRNISNKPGSPSDDKTPDSNTNRPPRVLGVLPLMDTKTLELRGSDQSQVELALALQGTFAAKGMTAAANLLSDYVKREEANVDTRNADPVVTTYANYDSFGFQIYPALRAVEKAGKSSSKAGYTLEPITFPLVVAIAVEKSELSTNKDITTFAGADYQTRWISNNDQWFIDLYWNSFLAYDNQFFWIFGKVRNIPPLLGFSWGNWVTGNSVYERVQRGLLLDDAETNLKQLENNNFDSNYRNTYKVLKTAFNALKSSAASTMMTTPLPSAKELFPTPDTSSPAIVGVYPTQIWRDRNTEFTVVLKNVTDTNAVSSVFIHGQKCDPTNITSYTDKASPYGSGLQGIVFNATLTNVFYSVTNSLTNSIDFVVTFKNPPALDNPAAYPQLFSLHATTNALLLIQTNSLQGCVTNVLVILTTNTTVASLALYTNQAILTPESTNVSLVLDAGAGKIVMNWATKEVTSATTNVVTEVVAELDFSRSETSVTFLSGRPEAYLKFDPINLPLNVSADINALTVTTPVDDANRYLKPVTLSVPMTLIGTVQQNPAVIVNRDAGEKITGIQINQIGTGSGKVDTTNMVNQIRSVLQESEHVPDPINVLH